MIDNKVSYICQLVFDKNVRDKVRDYLRPVMIQNRLLRSIYEVLLTYETEEIDQKVFISELLKKIDLSDKDIDTVIGMIATYHPIADELIEKAVNSIFDYVKESKLEYFMNQTLTNEMSTDGAIKAISELGDLKYEDDDNYLDMSDMNQLRTVHDAELPHEGIISSSLGILNDISMYHGYIPGDLVQIIAPPGVGKSMFMCQEGAWALYNKFKVCHIVLGDLNNFDIYVRYTARLMDRSMTSIVADASKNILHNLPIYRNLKVVVQEPETLDADDIYDKVTKLIKKGWKPDLVIIDYDLNVKGDRDNMYQTGGYLYNKMKQLAMENHLVMMIATQPKVSYNESEVLGKGAASESSRKQQIIDWMITIGKNQKCPEVGTLHVPKIRRGKDGLSARICFDSQKASIRTINKQEYDDRVKNFNNTDFEGIMNEFGGDTTGLGD